MPSTINSHLVFSSPCNIYRIWILSRYASIGTSSSRWTSEIYAAKRESVEGRRILYAVLSGGIARASPTYTGFVFGEQSPRLLRGEGAREERRSVARSCRRTVLRNPWPSRPPFQQIATRQETSNSGCCERMATRILYLSASRLNNSFYQADRLNP